MFEKHVFPTVTQALTAAIGFAQLHPNKTLNFETESVFDNDRKIIGYTVRIMDAEGFGLSHIRQEDVA